MTDNSGKPEATVQDCAVSIEHAAADLLASPFLRSSRTESLLWARVTSSPLTARVSRKEARAVSPSLSALPGVKLGTFRLSAPSQPGFGPAD